MSATSCCITNSTSEASVFLFFFFLGADRVFWCVLTGCQSSGHDIWCWRDRWELCWPGHGQGRRRHGGLRGKRMRGVTMALNTKFVYIDPWMYSTCVCGCLTEMGKSQRCASQVWGWCRGQTPQAHTSLCYCVPIITGGQNNCQKHYTTQ